VTAGLASIPFWVFKKLKGFAMKNAAFLVLTLIFSFSASGHAASRQLNFFYKAHVPATDLSCQEQANLLQERFISSTGITNAKAECRARIPFIEAGNTYQIDSLQVNYSSHAEAIVYAADFQINSLDEDSLAPYPGYDSYQKCLNDIENQTHEFEQRTKLQVVAAFCQNKSLAGLPLFTMRIEAFGRPQTKLQHTNLGLDPKDDPTFFSDIQKLVTEQKIQVVKKFERVIFYYADQPLRMRHLSLGYFKNLNECQSQLSESEALLTRSGSSRALAKCIDIYGVHQLLSFGLGNRMIFSDYGSGSEKYYSMTECTQDRERVLSGFQKGSVFGFICSPDILNDQIYIGSVYR
jgi:hypothetical protein